MKTLYKLKEKKSKYRYLNFYYNSKIKNYSFYFKMFLSFCFIFLFAIIFRIINKDFHLYIFILIYTFLNLIVIYFLYEELYIQYKILKFYKKMIFERNLYDNKLIDTPILKLKFRKDKVIVLIEEIGFYSYSKYIEIGVKLSQIFRNDFISINPKSTKYRNYTELIFLDNRKPLKLSENIKNKENTIKLDSHIEWNYKENPHMLIIASTGQGKSFFVENYLIKQLNKDGNSIIILDPKNEIQNLNNIKIVNKKQEILKTLRLINEEMNKRHATKLFSNYIFIVLEELAALKISLDKKEQKEFEKYFLQILLKGRSANINIISLSQSGNAELFNNSSLRDNFSCRIHLGKLTNEKAKMLFNMSLKDLPINKNIIGSGHIYIKDMIFTYITPRL